MINIIGLMKCNINLINKEKPCIFMCKNNEYNDYILENNK